MGQGNPLFTALTQDVSFGRFTLGVERVEVLIQSLFSGFSGVDGTANGLGGIRIRLHLALDG
jgi:hypothetical protein